MAGRSSDAPTLPDGDVHPGQMLGGRFRLDERQAAIGEIAVWDGEDEALSRPVTAYVVPPNHPLTDALIGAARQAAAATDARFLRVLDAQEFGPAEQFTFVISERVPGVSLQTLLQRGPLAGLDAAWVASELAQALAPMHEAGLSHQALDPSSVLITTTGAVRIAGFRLLAVLAGVKDADAAEGERADVLAIGRLLYAMATGTWPDVDSPAPPKTFGLPPARRVGEHLVAPTKTRPGVPPALDAVCAQVLDPRPGAAPLRTASALALALRRLLGNADPSADLGVRVANTLAGAQVAEEAGDEYAPAAVPDLDAEPLVVGDAEDVLADGAASEPVAAGEGGPKPPPVPQPGPTAASLGLPGVPILRRAARRLPRWWPLVVAVAVVALVVALVVKSCAAPPPPPPAPLTFTVPAVFDAKADGGDETEHTNQLPLITDGDPTTCWTTEAYTGDYVPAHKPGVGVVVDLGGASTLVTLTLTMGITPVGLSVMVPQGDAGKVDAAPMDSVKQWRSVLDVTVDASPQTLTLPAGETSRFVLLYITKLPDLPGKAPLKQTSICQLAITGNTAG